MTATQFPKVIFLCFILVFPQISSAEIFTQETNYQTCFTPREDCTKLITDTVGAAKTSIYVQAYSFTSAPIAKSIVDAKKRGLNVVVILDKSQIKNHQYSSSKFFMNNNIPVYIDYKPAIAHNKIMIIDNKVLITGSFNFTKAAQYKNAENVLIITDRKLAQKYLNNWQNRLKQSVEANKYLKEI